jgi:hypothetical protein
MSLVDARISFTCCSGFTPVRPATYTEQFRRHLRYIFAVAMRGRCAPPATPAPATAAAPTDSRRGPRRTRTSPTGTP